MTRLTFVIFFTILMLTGCDKKPSSHENDNSAIVLLKQGPVSAWKIPLTRQGQGDIICRYIVTDEDKPREYPVNGDSLILTIVEQDNMLTIVHSSNKDEMATSITFEIEHPSPGDVRQKGPKAIMVEPEEKTVWMMSWESPETRETVFSVELVAFLQSSP